MTTQTLPAASPQTAIRSLLHRMLLRLSNYLNLPDLIGQNRHGRLRASHRVFLACSEGDTEPRSALC